MQYRSVLNVNPVTDTNRIDIASQDGSEPDTTFVADNGIADKYCIIGKETVFTDFRGKSTS